MLYVYGIAVDLGGVADMTGVNGEPLVLVPFHHAIAVAGEVTAPPPLDAPGLKAQDLLVRLLHDRAGALLPMRFGMTATDKDALVRRLDTLAGLLPKLTAVRGREQMIVRVFGEVEHAAPAESHSGREYLEARVRAHKGTPELVAISQAAPALQRDVRLEPARGQGIHGSVYHLIDRGRSEEYRAAIESAAAGLRDVRIVITGPSPAYAFA
jgi:hypothetical protein